MNNYQRRLKERRERRDRRLQQICGHTLLYVLTETCKLPNSRREDGFMAMKYRIEDILLPVWSERERMGFSVALLSELNAYRLDRNPNI